MGSLRFFHSSKADFHKVNDNVVAIRVHVHASFARKYDDTGVTDAISKYNAYLVTKTFTPSNISTWILTWSTLGVSGGIIQTLIWPQ